MPTKSWSAVVSNGNGGAPLVKVTINGREVETQKGRLLIDIAEEIGVFVPRFCYHPGMKSVAVCRMCFVKAEGQPKLLPACATPVDDGMVFDTVDDNAVDAQKSMLEFLLINHPLDCPICDRAGECPLQDQTFKHGPGSSRYIEPKRTYEKALEISDLVVLDRERCVLCWRCVRFSDEIAGDRFIQLVDRGAGTQILTFTDEPFDSYFSGNTIQICPVGALTSKPYRFVARPWDLETAPSVCTYCSVGCPITNEARAGKMVRCQALPNEAVNDFWICDKGRYGYHHVSSDERLESPLARDESDQFASVTWGEALRRAAEGLKDKKVGVLAGGHLTTEDAFAISRFARKVLKTSDIDSRIQDAGAPYEAAMALAGVAGSTTKIDDLDDADDIVWVGPDPKEVLPVLYLRLRKAAIDGGARLTVISPRMISLDSIANRVIRTDDPAAAIAGLKLEGAAVVCWGPSAPGRDETPTVDALVGLASSTGGKLLVCPPHAGSQGLIDMGVHPALEPGYKPVKERGKDTRAILEAAANDELDALLIVGADPIADFPDADLARQAMKSKAFKVVIELFPTETVSHADVVFPSAAYAEREGTFTNLERRLQKLEELLPPPGTALEPWRIVARLANSLGDEWKWSNFSDVWKAIKSEVPTHKDVDEVALAQDMPAGTLHYESGFESEAADTSLTAIAGPGAQYPKGFRSGAPFQTGQNWPLSWELRAFEAEQRPGFIPAVTGDGDEDSAGRLAEESDTPFVSDPEASTEGTSATGAGSGRPLALYAGRQIYDEGTMVSKSVALRNLQKKPFVELNDEDAKELGVADGDEVVLVSGESEARAKVVIADITRGCAFVPYDQIDFRANELIKGIDPTVEVRPA
ncbi:MAG: NADH-quinone oxidoreductase subunit [Actinomycetota bacterium]|nr:NADH-quinone oxidoreductase subunit [Actinomycetota bacterium]